MEWYAADGCAANANNNTISGRCVVMDGRMDVKMNILGECGSEVVRYV